MSRAGEKRQYNQRIRDVEHSTFTPLVLSTTGGMGRAATTIYMRLATMLSYKRDFPYSKMIGWIRSCLSFVLLRPSIMSVGSQIICKQASKWSTSHSCQTPVIRGSAPRRMISDTLWTNAFVLLYKSFSFPFLSFSFSNLFYHEKKRKNWHKAMSDVEDLPLPHMQTLIPTNLSSYMLTGPFCKNKSIMQW